MKKTRCFGKYGEYGEKQDFLANTARTISFKNDGNGCKIKFYSKSTNKNEDCLNLTLQPLCLGGQSKSGNGQNKFLNNY